MTEGRAHPRRADEGAIAEAAAMLRSGRLVAFPTETVYGLGANASDDKAVAAVFAAKGRPQFNPLIVHLPGVVAAMMLVRFDDRAQTLARKFWPGPLTLVLRRKDDCPISLLAGAGLDTLAVRVPAHPIAQQLLAAAGIPLAAPSANRSGAVSPTTADHVAGSLGAAVDLILDGGACRVGIESTVIDLSSDRPTLLRPGGIAAEEIEAVIGPLGAAGKGGAPRSPGMMERHYATERPLRMNATDGRPGEALLAFGPGAPQNALNLSAAGDLVEAAANLFAHLHALDRPGVTGIAVMPIPETGLGRAINDRLRRAEAGS
jgi:L-threonylcarbamoyladenylate synthase